MPVEPEDPQELSKEQVIRLQALDLSVNSKAAFGGTTGDIIDRAKQFENYIKSGDEDAT